MKVQITQSSLLSVVVMFLVVPALYGMNELSVFEKLHSNSIKYLGFHMKKQARGSFRCVSNGCNTIMSREYPLDKEREFVFPIDPVALYRSHLELVNAIEHDIRGDNTCAFGEPFFRSGNIIHYHFAKCIEIAQDTGFESLPEMVANFFEHAFKVLHIIEEDSGTFNFYKDEAAAVRYLNKCQTSKSFFKKNTAIEPFNVVRKDELLHLRTIRRALERSQKGDIGPVLVISPLIIETKPDYVCNSKKTIKIESCSNSFVLIEDINPAVVDAIKNDELCFAQWLINKSLPDNYSERKCLDIAAFTGDVDLVLKVSQFIALDK